ncbi:Striatin family-domain-containing protein, partial [Thamnocephalis sphaerospora]
MLHPQGHLRKASEPDNGPPAYSLPGVLHFLQQEWRRFERDRNEWEIERAELKARVMVLEGERRGQDTAKVDLVRRIKMLEHALRLERGKRLSTEASAASLAASGTCDASEKTSQAITLPLSNTGTPLRMTASSQKTRAKSRDILKLCLQEVDQLSSFCGEQLAAAASTPSPNLPSPPIAIAMAANASGLDASGVSATSPPAVDSARLQADGRQRDQAHNTILITDETSPTLPPVDAKSPTVRLPRTVASTDLGAQSTNAVTSLALPGGVRRSVRPSNPTPDDQPDVRSPPQPSTRALDGVTTFASASDPATGRKRQTVFLPADMDVMAEGAAGETPRSPSLVGVKVDEIDDVNILERAKGIKVGPTFRIDAEGRKISTTRDAAGVLLSSSGSNEKRNPPQAADYFDFDEGDNYSTAMNGDRDSEDDYKMWNPRVTLRSHLDTVHAIDFHRRDLVLATGSEDGLVKIWNLEGLSSGTGKSKEYEPRATLRGHLGAVYGVQMSSNRAKCFSAGADAVVMVWSTPTANWEFVLTTKFIGHSDTIWDLRLQPGVEDEQKQLIASASADGTVKLWDVEEQGSPLRRSFGYEGAESGDGELARDIAPVS